MLDQQREVGAAAVHRLEEVEQADEHVLRVEASARRLRRRLEELRHERVEAVARQRRATAGSAGAPGPRAAGRATPPDRGNPRRRVPPASRPHRARSRPGRAAESARSPGASPSTALNCRDTSRARRRERSVERRGVRRAGRLGEQGALVGVGGQRLRLLVVAVLQPVLDVAQVARRHRGAPAPSACGSRPRASMAASAGSVPRTRSAGSRPPRTICSACTMNSTSRMPPSPSFTLPA